MKRYERVVKSWRSTAHVVLAVLTIGIYFASPPWVQALARENARESGEPHKPQLYLPSGDLSLGTVKLGQVVRFVIPLVNRGNTPVKIYRIVPG